METREERIARIRARHERRAERRAAEADRRFKAAQAISDFIPLGQPILVGHHSERRHRRDLERIDNNMRKGVEAAHDRDEAARKAASAEHTGIASSDADAVELLRDKLARLEAAQETMKAVNKAVRKHIKQGMDAVAAAVAQVLGSQEATAELLRPKYPGDRRIGYPGYALSNNNANIKRVRDRLARVQAQQAQPVKRRDGRDGVTIEDDPPANRIRLFFPDKPPADERAELKRNGYRWVPSLECWQAYRNARALAFARAYLPSADAAPDADDTDRCGCEVNAPESPGYPEYLCPCGAHCKEPECVDWMAWRAARPDAVPDVDSPEFEAFRRARVPGDPGTAPGAGSGP